MASRSTLTCYGKYIYTVGVSPSAEKQTGKDKKYCVFPGLLFVTKNNIK